MTLRERERVVRISKEDENQSMDKLIHYTWTHACVRVNGRQGGVLASGNGSQLFT
jgi:hypothetical protein